MTPKQAKKPVKPKKPPPKPKGRPSLYTAALAEKICKRLADGESLLKISQDAGFPGEATIRAWALDDVGGFSANYARARAIGYEKLADEILNIADTPVIGSKSVSKATGLEITEGDMIEHRRLQVEARKWMLSKMLPKVYGDRQHVEMEVIDKTPMADRMKQARERAKGK
jgi:hypothetical protein